MIVKREEAVLELAKWILHDLENSSAGAGRAGAMARAVAGKLGVNADLRAEHYLTLTAQEVYVANAINSYVEVRKALVSLHSDFLVLGWKAYDTSNEEETQ